MGCDICFLLAWRSSHSFQSTHPAWGATEPHNILFPSFLISIHAPRVGCDGATVYAREAARHFNPRTPRGVRLAVSRHFASWMTFQSTHPAWGATQSFAAFKTIVSGFQSTHPAWGATAKAAYDDFDEDISIHAPRVGCDFNNLIPFIYLIYFNPRTPRGVRHCLLLRVYNLLLFQSTHPAWGATPFGGFLSLLFRISIHAPRVGCDRRPIGR